MRKSFLAFALIALFEAFGVLCQALADGTSRDVSQRNKEAVLKAVQQITRTAEIPVRIYYEAGCGQDKESVTNAPVPFPPTTLRQPSNGNAGLAAVRELFRDDKNVVVTQGGDGVMRIRIGKVADAILATRISSVALDGTSRYNPDLAIAQIFEAKEADAALRSLRFYPVPSLGETLAAARKDMPHLPSSLTKVTIDAALDMIAKTWVGQGVVIYGACSDLGASEHGRPFWVEYAGSLLPKSDNWRDVQKTRGK